MRSVFRPRLAAILAAGGLNVFGVSALTQTGRSPGVDVADDEPRRQLRRGHAQSPSFRTLAHLAHVPPVAIGFQPFRRSRMALTSQAFLNEIA